MSGLIKKIFYLFIILLLFAEIVWASPTGLNNIPTADVVGDKILAIQEWLTAGENAKPVFMTGFKYGIADKIEIGLDSKTGSGKAGPVALQGKLRIIDLDFGLAGLIGAEGVVLSNRISRYLVPYAVATQDLKFIRLTGGYNFQKDNLGMFFGADMTVPLFDQKLIVRGDLKQVNDGKNLLVSGGYLLTLPFNLVLENWISVPTEKGQRENVTVKLNYVLYF